MISLQQITDSCLTEFRRLENSLFHDASLPEWLRILKKDAIKYFSVQGFPTVRQEDWRYSPLSSLVNNRFMIAHYPSPALLESIKAETATYFLEPSWPRLCFINGYFIEEWSQIPNSLPGLKVGRLANSLQLQNQSLADQEYNMNHLIPWFQSQPLTTLNTALFLDGACVCLEPNVELGMPIHFLFIHAQDYENKVMIFPRNQVHLKANSQAQLIESHVNLQTPTQEIRTSLSDSVTQIKLDEGAELTYLRRHESSCQSHQFSSTYASLGPNSRFSSLTTAFNTFYSRDYSFIQHDGEHSESQILGLYCLGNHSSTDQFIQVEHLKPCCKSAQLMKGIIGGSSQSVFSGKLVIQKEAGMTEATQVSKNLVLSDSATAYVKPQVEINAEDVKCFHRASASSLDPKAIFYLRARGIDLKDSHFLLAQSFAQEIMTKITQAPLRMAIERELNATLHSTIQELVS